LTCTARTRRLSIAIRADTSQRLCLRLPLRPQATCRAWGVAAPWSEPAASRIRRLPRNDSAMSLRAVFWRSNLPLSGQIDRLGIASSQRTLLAMTYATVLMQS